MRLKAPHLLVSVDVEQGFEVRDFAVGAVRKDPAEHVLQLVAVELPAPVYVKLVENLRGPVNTPHATDNTYEHTRTRTQKRMATHESACRGLLEFRLLARLGCRAQVHAASERFRCERVGDSDKRR
eukprot:5738907-Pyramimonas_sp.AAC.2